MKTKNLVTAGIIAALYVVLTMISAMLGLSSGVIQFRISEALTILPYFTPAAIPGLFLGCLIANILSGSIVVDVIFGSVATLIGAIGSYILRKYKYLVALPPVISNMVIVPFVLKYAYHLDDAMWFMAITVGIGEIVCCCGLGNMLLYSADKIKR
jgi:uncharacterized membrane protein